MGPVSASERIELIDILRGLALFGIITANMRGFFGPAEAYFDSRLLWRGLGDSIAQGFVEALIQGKFVTLFAFLFGLGFAIQMTRAEERGRKIWFYPRRLAILLLFGIVHSFLIWWGDILFAYALMGFFLIPFRRRKQKTIAIWALALAVLPVFLGLGWYVAGRLGHAPSGSPPKPDTVKRAIEIYSHGSWREIMNQRFRDWMLLNANFIFTPVFLLPRFLAGLWIWRSGLLTHPWDYRGALKLTCLLGVVIGLPANILVAVVGGFESINMNQPSAAAVLSIVPFTIAVPALSACYASGIALLALSEKWRPRVQPFAAVGRMALTTYLMQSIICTLLFYSYGLGWFGRIGPALGLIPTFVVFAAQVWFANWWLAHWQFGPVEWVWRSLTYGRRQPMRREQVLPAAA